MMRTGSLTNEEEDGGSGCPANEIGKGDESGVSDVGQTLGEA